MNNHQVADFFSLLSKLMDIHGENSFRSKAYAAAAFTIEKLPVQVAETDPATLAAIKGIGEATAKKISELLLTGKITVLSELIARTPPGIIEMMQVNGLGPKKIQTIWRELGVESVGELLYACQENRLMLLKGFGEKTQEKVKAAIEFMMKNQGHFLYAEVEELAIAIDEKLKKSYPSNRFSITGALRQQSEIITQLEWVTTLNKSALLQFAEQHEWKLKEEKTHHLLFTSENKIQIAFHISEENNFGSILFNTSASEEFLQAFHTAYPLNDAKEEADCFAVHQLPFIAPSLREFPSIIKKAAAHQLPNLITTEQIRGIIHSHSNWSDGLNDLSEMAEACKAKGYEYLVISDHSKSAFYANGLQPDRVLAQHRQIEELNKKLAPFKIFKSIESDILHDGSLDYDNELLASFDLVIASVHSQLSMSEEKAMQRLLTAIENPYTRILGHPTGRLLLSRNGYPIDHQKIIEACSKNKVVIELNAHPRRLDIDWRWIPLAIEAGVMISINPDAHSIDGFNDVRYGVLTAQKAGVEASHNLSSQSLAEIEQFVQQKKY